MSSQAQSHSQPSTTLKTHTKLTASASPFSTIRQVPDNQEVYIDKEGFTSIVFDIAERVGGPGSTPEIDGQALTIHLEDIVGDEVDRTKVWNSTSTHFSRLEYVVVPLTHIRQSVAGFSLYGRVIELLRTHTWELFSFPYHFR